MCDVPAYWLYDSLSRHSTCSGGKVSCCCRKRPPTASFICGRSVVEQPSPADVRGDMVRDGCAGWSMVGKPHCHLHDWSDAHHSSPLNSESRSSSSWAAGDVDSSKERWLASTTVDDRSETVEGLDSSVQQNGEAGSCVSPAWTSKFRSAVRDPPVNSLL